MDEMKTLKFNYDRRFGVEIELNSLDRRDFKARPLRQGELPEGTNYIATLLMENLRSPVRINKWNYTHNNFAEWVVKPDSSCGIEVCSPAFKGWTGLKQVVKTIDILEADPKILVDDRCSFHVHVNVMDCLSRIKRTGMGFNSSGYEWSKSYDLAAILAWWTKCEPVFLDSVPADRKRSRYCMAIGSTDLLHAN